MFGGPGRSRTPGPLRRPAKRGASGPPTFTPSWAPVRVIIPANSPTEWPGRAANATLGRCCRYGRDWPNSDIGVLSESMNDTKLPPGIGPHEGRELELLLAGQKPVAKFRLDGLSEEHEGRFRKAVERGEILEFDFPAEELHLHRRYYCRRGEEWRVKVKELVDRSDSERRDVNLSEEDWHRFEGALLGYDKADIERFIEHVRSRRE